MSTLTPSPDHKPGCNNMSGLPNDKIAECYCQDWDDAEAASQLAAHPDYLKVRAEMTPGMPPPQHKDGCFNANHLPNWRIGECYCQLWVEAKIKQEVLTYPDYLKRRAENTPKPPEKPQPLDPSKPSLAERAEITKAHTEALNANTKALWAHTAAMKTLAQALHTMPTTMKLRY